jgi:nucleotide-binding universal stress UspA family protein
VLRSILVPLDGSRFAETAAAPAAHLARAAGARLHLVMVHEPAIAVLPAADVPVPVAPEDPAVRGRAAAYLADQAARLGTVGPGPVSHDVIDGLAAPALAGFVERQRPDLVVMATHGRGPLSRFWLGSVADHLVRHASVPLLLLRPREDATDPVTVPLRSVLVPHDLSPEAEAIFPVLADLARVAGTRVTLVYVIEPVLGVSGSVPPYPVAVPHDLLDTTRDRARKHLEAAAGRLRAHGVDVAVAVVVGLGIAATLLEVQQRDGHDFIAMTTHGAGGVRRALVGSVADKVVRAATRPVLVLRPEA